MSGKLDHQVLPPTVDLLLPSKQPCCDNNHNHDNNSSNIKVSVSELLQVPQASSLSPSLSSQHEFQDEMCRELSATIFPREDNEDWEERCKFLENCIRVLLRHCDETVGVVKALEQEGQGSHSQDGEDAAATPKELKALFDKFMLEIKSSKPATADSGESETATEKKLAELSRKSAEMEKLNGELNRELSQVISEKNNLSDTVESLRQDVSSLASILSLRSNNANLQQLLLMRPEQNDEAGIAVTPPSYPQILAMSNLSSLTRDLFLPCSGTDSPGGGGNALKELNAENNDKLE